MHQNITLESFGMLEIAFSRSNEELVEIEVAKNLEQKWWRT